MLMLFDPLDTTGNVYTFAPLQQLAPNATYELHFVLRLVSGATYTEPAIFGINRAAQPV